jgi:hypothetical protein
MKELVFVHGRAQEHLDASALKREWIEAFRQGLDKSGLKLPIAEDAIRFPYYGQTLYDLVTGVTCEEVAEVIVRGDNADDEERAFMREVIQEVKEQAQVSDRELAEFAGQEVVERGPLNWRWLQAVLRVLDRRVPLASGTSIAVATNDVYQYLNSIGIRDAIEDGVRQALRPGAAAVVVGHSLGSVVCYCLLRREGKANRWDVPLFLTLGSPLAVRAIKRRLAPNKHPQCVGRWFNCLDRRDVVALHPLDAVNFPISPPIENKTDVQNDTPNRHGISGYLSDKDVAKRIHDALVT